MMSKGSRRRPRQISREEEELRWDYITGKISIERFNCRYRILEKIGKVIRGR